MGQIEQPGYLALTQAIKLVGHSAFDQRALEIINCIYGNGGMQNFIYFQLDGYMGEITWQSGVMMVTNQPDINMLSAHRKKNSKNNKYTVLEPGDIRVLEHGQKDTPHNKLDNKCLSLAEESNSKRNSGVSGGLDESNIACDSLSENVNKIGDYNLFEKNFSNSIPAQELNKIQPSESLNSSNNRDAVQPAFKDLVENIKKRGVSVRNLEGFFKLLSKDFSFPDIEDLSGNDPPEKSLFAPVVNVFSGRKAALNAEEENNSKKLEGFSDAVEYIFIKCGLLESDKNEVAISVKSVDDIPGSSSEKNLMDLFIDYYAYLISNNEIKYVKKSYKELKFNCLQTSKGPGDFSLKKYNIMRDTIKGIIDWYPNYLLEEAAGKYKYGESTLAEMSNILSLGVCDYLKKNCSQASNEERGKILEEFVGDIDFNIRIKIAKTEVSRKTHVETLDYKRKIRSAMLEYNGCSDKNPEVTRFLRFMALAVYAESLEMKKWLTYTDLQEFLRQFKPKASS